MDDNIPKICYQHNFFISLGDLPYIHHTPVFTNSTFDKLIGRKAFFKAENLQKTGSFKARGALNSVRFIGPKKKSSPIYLDTF
jgi:hypothetical protein